VQIEDQIDDCQRLIEYFSGMSTSAIIKLVSPVKTGEEEEVDTKDTGRSGFKKGPKAHSTSVTGEMSSSSSINLPSYTRSTLHSLSIPRPSSPSDVPHVVENLKTRKARLEEIDKIQQSLLEPRPGKAAGR
jgi:hypothetical protein